MRLNIRVSWPAGLWINSTAEILLVIASKLGYDVITDLEYESRIKGWTNYFDVFISDFWKSISKFIDVLIVFDYKALEKNLESLNSNAIIIASDKTLSKIEKDLSSYKVLSLEILDKYENTYLLWILTKLLSIPLNFVNEELIKVFSKKWEDIVNKNINIVKEIVDGYKIDFNYDVSLKEIWDSKEITYWNKAIAYWAIEWWLGYFSAYPMTPASTVLTEIINSKKVTYLQAEDEIAVMNSALWASFTGKRSMVATSWGWFALMTEALSFAVQAEIPIVAVLSQRAGPSTWTPTYFEQGDLNFALNPTFGDFNHILLCPSSIEEAYNFGWLALNLADKYQSIVIVLIDKQMSENFSSVEKLSVPEVDRWKMLDIPPVDYKRYELNPEWISPRVDVWTKNGDFIATSYEHDEYGATTESSEMKKMMTEKRARKLDNFFEREGIYWYEVMNKDAKKMLVTMSFTSYTAREFVKNNPEFGLIVMKVVKPIDERLFDDLRDKEEVIFVESNYSGQLENYVVKELGLKQLENLKISNLRKYDLYPFYYEDFEELK